MVARYLQKLSHLTPSDRRDNFCKYRATMKFLAPFLKEMDFSTVITWLEGSSANF